MSQKNSSAENKPLNYNPSTKQIFAECLYYGVSTVLKKILLMTREYLNIEVEIPNAVQCHTLDSPKKIKQLLHAEPPCRDLEINGSISVIIPTYNEENSMVKTLESVLNNQKDLNNCLEIIISDGGSSDNTVNIAKNFFYDSKFKNFHFINGGYNRATSQNIGAQNSSGSIILFLHADSILPYNWIQFVRNTMSIQKNLAGCFEFKMVLSTDQNNHDNDSSSSSNFVSNIAKNLSNAITSQWSRIFVNLLQKLTNFRSRYFQLPYGDQALFFRRAIFLNYFSRFPEVQLLEDLILIKEIRKYGNIFTIPKSVETSARRWEINGFLWNTLLNQVQQSSYFQFYEYGILLIGYDKF